MFLNKRFIKYALFAVVITYSCAYISSNYKIKTSNTKIHEIGGGKVSVNSQTLIEDNKNRSNFELVAEGAFFTPVVNNTGSKILFSNGNDILELELQTKKIRKLIDKRSCFNPIYNRNNSSIVFARSDGIYLYDIEKRLIKSVVTSSDPQISFAKPNFTNDGAIIYFRGKVIPKNEAHGFIEKEASVYKISIDGKHEEKLTDGYNPTITNDCKKLIYELKDNLYIMDLESKKTEIIDNGKYASLSHDGKYISYAKYERDITKYIKGKVSDKLFIDKEYSNIYIAEILNPKNKHKITIEEYGEKEQEIDDWAKTNKNKNTEQHFLVVSKMAYFDTAWSLDNNELYISCYNAEKGDFELLKYYIKKKQ